MVIVRPRASKFRQRGNKNRARATAPLRKLPHGEARQGHALSSAGPFRAEPGILQAAAPRLGGRQGRNREPGGAPSAGKHGRRRYGSRMLGLHLTTGVSAARPAARGGRGPIRGPGGPVLGAAGRPFATSVRAGTGQARDHCDCHGYRRPRSLLCERRPRQRRPRDGTRRRGVPGTRPRDAARGTGTAPSHQREAGAHL